MRGDDPIRRCNVCAPSANAEPDAASAPNEKCTAIAKAKLARSRYPKRPKRACGDMPSDTPPLGESAGMRAELTCFAVFHIFVMPVNDVSRQFKQLHVDRMATPNMDCDAKAPIKSYIVTMLFVKL